MRKSIDGRRSEQGRSAGCGPSRTAAAGQGGRRPGRHGGMMADLFVPGGIVTALEEAAVAIGRLDAALAGTPLRRAWTFWSELDAARRHAEADGRRVGL